MYDSRKMLISHIELTFAFIDGEIDKINKEINTKMRSINTIEVYEKRIMLLLNLSQLEIVYTSGNLILWL